jgi:hypothetical protein
MAKKPKVIKPQAGKPPAVSKTRAVRDYPKTSDAASPDPLENERIVVRALLQKDPTGRSVHDELYAAVKSRAEAIWLQTGGTHGHQESDWRQAREELGVPPEVFV